MNTDAWRMGGFGRVEGAVLRQSSGLTNGGARVVGFSKWDREKRKRDEFMELNKKLSTWSSITPIMGVIRSASADILDDDAKYSI